MRFMVPTNHELSEQNSTWNAALYIGLGEHLIGTWSSQHCLVMQDCMAVVLCDSLYVNSES